MFGVSHDDPRSFVVAKSLGVSDESALPRLDAQRPEGPFWPAL
jgi:hypothetical protein